MKQLGDGARMTLQRKLYEVENILAKIENRVFH
jgi:hypothetical protein